jgi:hypothetical protein
MLYNVGDSNTSAFGDPVVNSESAAEKMNQSS